MASILIVDDHPDNRELLLTLLGYGGHRLLEATDGAQALTLARVEHPDLIIADILMPTMDGYELVQQLRADPATTLIPVIFFTAHYLEREARALAQSCGVTHILSKPCEPEEILRTVAMVIDGEAPTSPACYDEFDRQHLRLLTDKLNQKVQELQTANERLNTLIELSLQLGSERDPARLLQSFCHAARTIIGARHAMVCTAGEENQKSRRCYTSGIDAGTAALPGDMAPEPGILDAWLAEGRPRRLHNLQGDPRLVGLPPDYPPVHTFLGVPIVSPTRSYGWLCCTDKMGGQAFSAEDERLAGILAAQVGRIYENGKLYAEIHRHAAELEKEIAERKAAADHIQYLANHDYLTDLPNRVLLEDLLSQALANARRNQTMVALLFFDLDRFKTINDSLGHHVGDLLLQAVAKRLKDCLRSADIVARLGGDEFVIVIPNINEINQAARVADKILESMRPPYMVDGQELTMTPSIGISVYPHDGEVIATLIKNADAAMYHAKEIGRNNYQFFTHSMNTSALERLSLENSLRRALEREEFLLHYQPQVDLESGRTIATEALIRWRHPELGMIPPAKFIPIAEDSGLIIALGEWVLREACLQNKQWQQAGLAAIPVAINLSALQFRQKNFQEIISTTLQQTGLDPHYLELELTESILLQNTEITTSTLQALKAIGLQLSIDDFGTGYSSLSYLKRLPIDKLKIDRSFVQDISTDPDDAAISSAIISMAHKLRLKVIAEGVETEAQLAFLKAKSCDEVQGYYFSRPLDPEAMITLLGDNSTHFTLPKSADSGNSLGTMGPGRL